MFRHEGGESGVGPGVARVNAQGTGKPVATPCSSHCPRACERAMNSSSGEAFIEARPFGVCRFVMLTCFVSALLTSDARCLEPVRVHWQTGEDTFKKCALTRRTGTGEEQYPNLTARRAVDALTRAAGSHRSPRAALEHVHTVPAPRGVAGRTSRAERRAGLHEPAGRVRIGHHRRIDDSGRRRLRVVPDASLAPRAVDLTAGRRDILAQVRIDQVRGQTRTEPRANGGCQSKVEGAAIVGPTIVKIDFDPAEGCDGGAGG